MAVVIDQKLIALGQKLEVDGLADLQALLVPALLAEIEDISPEGVQSVEVMVFGALQGAAQNALASLVSKIMPVPPAA